MSAVPLAMYLAFGDRHAPTERDQQRLDPPPSAAKVKPSLAKSETALLEK